MNSQYIKFFRESLIALGITIFGELITGSLWGSFRSEFLLIAGIIALIPVIGENRGNISGIFTSRIGTGLHLGSIKPSLRRRTKELNDTIIMNIILTLSIPVWTALVVYAWDVFTGGTTSYFQFFFVAFVAALIMLTIQPLLTLIISFIVYKRGLDPDVVVYPVISVIADVITSLAILTAVTLEIMYFKSSTTDIFEKLAEVLALVYFASFITISFSATVRAKLHLNLDVFHLFKESLPVILTSIMIGSFVGYILDNEVSNNNATVNIILLILPIFMSYSGAAGSVIGSKFTTSYHLGALTTRSGKLDTYLFSPAILIGVCVALTAVLGVVGFTISGYLNFNLPANVTIINYMLACVLIGMITTILSIIIALVLGNITFRRGLDADNVIVPLSTTLGDFVAIVTVVFITSVIFL